MTRSDVTYSIRSRVLSGAVLLVVVVGLILIWLARANAVRAADEAFDRVLIAAALSIADQVQLEEGFVTVDVPYSALAALDSTRLTRAFYRVAGPNGAFLSGYQDLGERALPAAGPQPVFEDPTYRGVLLRLVTVGRYVATPDLSGWATVHVAETREGREALASDFTRQAIIPVAGLGLATLFLVWLGLGRAFAPFAELRTDLERRTSTDLAPLHGAYPREVMPIVGALNAFMGRLGANLETLRGLVADAAHQLRTPLAALRAQAEVARQEADVSELRRRVDRIHVNAVAASQLVGQMLADATIAHRLETVIREPIDLVAVIDDVLTRLDDGQSMRIQRRIATRASTGAIVLGDRIALREMFRNIVDNALRYAPEGPVVVSLERVGHASWSLMVSDRGPGIPAEERAAALERFSRGLSARGLPGSGLGFSIARTVARACGGDLALEDTAGGGLTARVMLPALRAPTTSPVTPAMLLAVALVLVAPNPAGALTEERIVLPATSGRTEGVLRIASDGEHRTIEALIRAFQTSRPGVEIEYRKLDSRLLHRSVTTAVVSGDGPDLVVSSAVDLQAKLVNDGYARRHPSNAARALPRWAQWRFEAFGFTYEPVVLAYNPKLLSVDRAPRSRLRLAQLLEENQQVFRGKVITYDITRSGAGYVFAAFDAVISPIAWRLTRALGDVDVQLAETSLEMIEAVASGKAIIAYNLPASAGVIEAARALGVELVAPDDYSIIITRSLLIPASARAADLAAAFIDLALSPAGQSHLGAAALLPPGSFEMSRTRAGAPGHPIPLGPAALTFVDERKRTRFMDTWIQLVVKP